MCWADCLSETQFYKAELPTAPTTCLPRYYLTYLPTYLPYLTSHPPTTSTSSSSASRGESLHLFAEPCTVPTHVLTYFSDRLTYLPSFPLILLIFFFFFSRADIPSSLHPLALSRPPAVNRAASSKQQQQQGQKKVQVPFSLSPWSSNSR